MIFFISWNSSVFSVSSLHSTLQRIQIETMSLPWLSSLLHVFSHEFFKEFILCGDDGYTLVLLVPNCVYDIANHEKALPIYAKRYLSYFFETSSFLPFNYLLFLGFFSLFIFFLFLLFYSFEIIVIKILDFAGLLIDLLPFRS